MVQLPPELSPIGELRDDGATLVVTSKGVTQLPESLGQLGELQTLDLSSCSKLTSLPESMGNLTGLQKLDLCGCSGLLSLPWELGQLTGLQTLYITDCSGLTSIPNSLNWLTPQSLDLSGCSGLTCLPKDLDWFRQLETLDLRGCSSLPSLPNGMGVCSGLKTLDLRGCSSLTSLPDSMGSLINLRTLRLEGCRSLTSLPDSMGSLINLRTLRLEGCRSLTSLPKSLGWLIGLQTLNLKHCRSLTSLPEHLGWLSGLDALDLDGCDDLPCLPDSVAKLRCIRGIDKCKRYLELQYEPLPADNEAESALRERFCYTSVVRRRTLLRLATARGQEPMLTTLERMAWVAVLLVTATFAGFATVPAAATDPNTRSWAFTSPSACTTNTTTYGQCVALRGFFVADFLSFSFGIGRVVAIVAFSLPRMRYADVEREAGRFWLVLVAVWALLCCALIAGFVAFVFAAVAIAPNVGALFGPMATIGAVFIMWGVVIVCDALLQLHPGNTAVGRALNKAVREYLRCKEAIYEVYEDIEMQPVLRPTRGGFCG